MQMTDTGIYIAHYTEDGTITGTIQISESDGIRMQQNKEDGTAKVSVTMHPTDGLGVWFEGVGYNGLGFVNDGNGHAVLGK